MIDVDYNEYKKTIAENMKLIVENHRLEEVEKGHQKLNGELREEIERLNNIINELEKWLKQQYGLDKEEWEYSSPYIWHEHITLEFVLNKLQELKGSDKE